MTEKKHIKDLVRKAFNKDFSSKATEKDSEGIRSNSSPRNAYPSSEIAEKIFIVRASHFNIENKTCNLATSMMIELTQEEIKWLINALDFRINSTKDKRRTPNSILKKFEGLSVLEHGKEK